MHLLVCYISVNTIPRFSWKIRKYTIRNNGCLKSKRQMKERNTTHSVVDVFTVYLETKGAQNKFEKVKR